MEMFGISLSPSSDVLEQCLNISKSRTSVNVSISRFVYDNLVGEHIGKQWRECKNIKTDLRDVCCVVSKVRGKYTNI